MIWIGIDPGKITGVGVWHSKGEILDLRSGSLIEMYTYIKGLHGSFADDFHLRIEDSRLRKWFGANTKGKAQGAGSIKRDCSIWEEICEFEGWNYSMVHPIKGATKMKHKQFCRLTKWDGGRTNSHQRDAFMLVWGLKTKSK